MKLLAGLGNPGKKYEMTRHNVGWMVVEKIAAEESVAFKDQNFSAVTASCIDSGEKVVLLKSKTYMNESGNAVGGARGYFGMENSDILVIHDDIDLPFGSIRFRREGSSGGHNGLKSIARHIGQNFHRLKLGVGPEERQPGFDAAKFVLADFSSAEKLLLPALVDKAVQAARLWLREGLDSAMGRFNGKAE